MTYIGAMYRVKVARCGHLAREVSMQICGFRVRKEPLHQRLGVRPFNQIGVQHPACSVEGSDRQRTDAQRLWNLAVQFLNSLGTLCNEDLMAGAVRASDVNVKVVDEKHRRADLGVAERNAIRETGRRVGEVAHGTVSFEFPSDRLLRAAS
jgi:hypothetical protein